MMPRQSNHMRASQWNPTIKPIYKNGKLPKYYLGKDEEDPFAAQQAGRLISAQINQKANAAIIQQNKEHDQTIANKKGYGWSGLLRTPIQTANEAVKEINPAWGFWNIPEAAISMIGGGADMNNATKDDLAFWSRHLGFPRDVNSMPITGIRFSGDYNQDGSLRLPDAEYTGLSKLAKDFIRAGILNKKIIPKKGGGWTQFKESGRNPGTTPRNSHGKYTSHMADYSIRENNQSGIYDVYDTYDFPWYVPVFNRDAGKLIEIRDTIWGPNARPEMYNPSFSVKNKITE